MKKLILTLLGWSMCLGLSAQSFDTTGINSNWELLLNSYNDWQKGAFDANRDLNNFADFGWGEYDVSTHIIKGDSIYIIKTVNGNYKAVSIDQLVSGVFTVTYSDLDGSNRKTKTFDRTNYPNRNFMYFSLDQELTKDLEPDNEDWDIVFQKFLTIFPGFGAYPVSGILSNIDVQSSKIEFAPGGTYSVADTANFPMTSDISNIGYDWKNSFAGITYDTLVYYILDQSGKVNELKFIDYSGSATAVYKFEVNGVLDSVILGSSNTNQVYYSLENRAIIKTNSDNNWDIALFAKSDFSSIPVRINDANGAELYVYPRKDIGHWNSIGLQEKASIQTISSYPNPASDQITIVLHSENSEKVDVDVLDQTGRSLKSINLNINSGLGEYKMDLEGLAKGMYLLKIEGKNFTEISQILIQP